VDPQCALSQLYGAFQSRKAPFSSSGTCIPEQNRSVAILVNMGHETCDNKDVIFLKLVN
jgi:hypothetical protein